MPLTWFHPCGPPFPIVALFSFAVILGPAFTAGAVGDAKRDKICVLIFNADVSARISRFPRLKRSVPVECLPARSAPGRRVS